MTELSSTAPDMERRSFNLVASDAATGGKMTSYELKVTSPNGDRAVVVTLHRADDMDALQSALEICREHTIEVWDGERRVGCAVLSGTPILGL